MKVTTRVNQQIRVKEVRLIAADGAQVGIVPIENARQMALEAELDLVEVAPNENPPVCRIMDFGHILYEQKRKSKLARKKVRAQDLKEIQLRPNTDKHDFETKLEHARDFMDKGHKVKFTVKYRGREMAHYERGTMILQRAEAELGEVAEVEMRPSSRGRTQSMVLAPKKRKKDAKEREPAGAAAPASQPASPGSVPG